MPSPPGLGLPGHQVGQVAHKRPAGVLPLLQTSQGVLGKLQDVGGQHYRLAQASAGDPRQQLTARTSGRGEGEAAGDMRFHHQAAADRLGQSVCAAYTASLPWHCALMVGVAPGGHNNLPLHLVGGSKQVVCKLRAVHILQRRGSR